MATLTLTRTSNAATTRYVFVGNSKGMPFWCDEPHCTNIAHWLSTQSNTYVCDDCKAEHE
jgi:hypothetical protein